MVEVGSVRAVAGKGLEGDRYANGVGTFSGQAGTGREVTLIEAEAIESLAREDDGGSLPGQYSPLVGGC